jgi:hypothetical protein
VQWKTTPHDQSDAIFKADGEERVSRKRDIMGEVLELLKKNEEGGGRTRAMGLQALVSQQTSMTNTITSLLQQALLLKEELRQAEDSDEVQELEDEIQDVIQSRRVMLLPGSVTMAAGLTVKSESDNRLCLL